MPIEHKEESKTVQHGSGRSQKGHSGDKYSDESPSKDYKDYRADYPKESETGRKEAKEITDNIKRPYFIGKKNKDVAKQELISHIQNYQETFNNAMTKAWKVKLAELMVKLEE